MNEFQWNSIWTSWWIFPKQKVPPNTTHRENVIYLIGNWSDKFRQDFNLPLMSHIFKPLAEWMFNMCKFSEEILKLLNNLALKHMFYPRNLRNRKELTFQSIVNWWKMILTDIFVAVQMATQKMFDCRVVMFSAVFWS